MANLTAVKHYRTRPRGINAFRVKAGERIFHGSLVGIQVGGNGTSVDGRVIRWDGDTLTTGARTIMFLGVAIVPDTADGFVDGNAAEDIEVMVDTSGLVLEQVSVTGAGAITGTGDLVYASDDNVLTLTATTGRGAIGFVLRSYSAGSAFADVQLFTPAEFRAFAQTI